MYIQLVGDACPHQIFKDQYNIRAPFTYVGYIFGSEDHAAEYSGLDKRTISCTSLIR